MTPPDKTCRVCGRRMAWRKAWARDCARRLVAQGLVVITQRGRVVDPSTARGAIRIARADA